MVKVSSIYQGHKHCLATHEPSGSELETDAPKDNQGLGERFSPTDLVATALGTCILTTLAIVADRDGVDIKGATATTEKVMHDKPRRISSLKTIISLPKNIPEDYRQKMEHVTNACPVKKSLHPDIEVPVELRFVL